MQDEDKTKEQLIAELQESRRRLAESEMERFERKPADEALRESEHRYRELFEAGSDAILFIDSDTGLILEANCTASAMFGYGREELLTKRNWELSEEPEETRRITQGAKSAPGQVITVPLRYLRRKDGTIFPTEITGRSFFWQKRSVFIAAIRDVSDRRRSEELLKERDIRFKKLSSHVPGMIYQFMKKTDGTYCVPFTTESIKDVFGCSPQDVREDFSPIASVIFPEDSDRLIHSIEVSAERLAAWQCEYRVQIPGRPIRWMLGQSTPEKLDDGSIVWHGFNMDITERKLAEAALQASEREKAALNEIANVFLTIPDERVYEEVLRVVLKRTQSGYGVFGFISETGDLVIPSMTREVWSSCHVPEKSIVFPVHTWGNSLWGRAIREQQTFCSDGPFQTPEGHVLIDNFLTVPVIFGSKTIGLLSVANKDGGYTEEDKIEMGRIANAISPILNVRLERDRQRREREKAEEALRESEERFRAAFMGSPNAIAVSRKDDGVWVDVNEAALEMFGYSREESVGRSALETNLWVNPRDWQEIVEVLDQGGRVMSREVQLRRKDGGIMMASVSVSPLVLKGKKHLLLVTEDITERVRQQEEIVLLNRLYAVLSKVSQAVVRATSPQTFLEEACRVIVKDGSFLLSWIGQVEAATNAVAPIAFCGESVDYVRNIAVYADDRPEGRGPTGTCIRERRPIVYNDFLHDPLAQPWRDRAAHFGLRAVAAFPIELEGRVWGALTIYSDKIEFFGEKDVTLLEKVAGDLGFALDNLARERLRAQAEEALRESEEKYRKLFENAPIGIFRTSSVGQALSVNSAMAQILGLGSPQQALEHYSDLGAQLYLSPERREKFLQLLREKGHTEDFEYEAQTCDGRNIRLNMNARVESCDKDGLMIIEGFTTDITERKRTEEERQRLEAQLRQAQKMEAVGTLAGGIAHEFNNILGIILGNAELAGGDIPQWNPANYNLDEIKSASLRARDIVRQLLTFSRKGEGNQQPLDLALLVKDAVRFLRASIPTSIEIRQNIADGCHAIIGDSTQIHQVMLNLSANAAHAMEEEGGNLKFSLRSVILERGDQCLAAKLSPGEYVLLEVSDTGAGISPEIMDRIFDPYFTTKEVGKGTGMGLAVVHGIVEAHGGSIRVESSPGRGTTFKILLPATREEAGTLLELEEKLQTGSERILFIDDEPSIAKLGRLMLERLGYQVQSETNPQKALEIFASSPEQFDMIITDTTMPGLTGDQLIQKILEIRPAMKTILCTGYSQRVNEESANAIGARAFIMKPLDNRKLAETVRKVLDGTA